jgi:[ribosomal protein S5]-alanine N-acetyltransferase
MKDNGPEAIGAVDYRNYEEPYGNRGFWLAEPYWGRGIMSEAVYAVNDWVFNVLGVQRMLLTNLASNTASRRIKEKTGSRYTGIIQMPHHNGETETETWELTNEMWEENKAKNRKGVSPQV